MEGVVVATAITSVAAVAAVVSGLRRQRFADLVEFMPTVAGATEAGVAVASRSITALTMASSAPQT
jgi:hypothetical protein